MNTFRAKEAVNHKDNGFDVENIHSGQYRAYGDSYYVYKVKSDKSQEEVEKYCTENVRQCKLTTKQYLTEERDGVKDFGDHFRSNYKLENKGENEYLYTVNNPSTH